LDNCSGTGNGRDNPVIHVDGVGMNLTERVITLAESETSLKKPQVTLKKLEMNMTQ
jgi:hypothetical protein